MKILHPDRYEKWSTTLADWETTGLSVAAYCREHSIPRWKFFDWKRRIEDHRKEDEPAGFVAVEFETEGNGCGLGVCVGGVQLMLHKGFDESELVRAVNTLRRLGC